MKFYKKFPYEIKCKILLLLPFEKVVGIDSYIDSKLYNKEVHTLKWAIDNGCVEVVKFLINKGVDVNQMICYVYINGDKSPEQTTIKYAIRKNKYEIVKLLFENNADININEYYYNYRGYSIGGRKIYSKNAISLYEFIQNLLGTSGINDRILDMILSKANLSKKQLRNLIHLNNNYYNTYNTIQILKKYI